MDFGTIDDLSARLKATLSDPKPERPIAILAGSGLTASVVPGVQDIVHAIRAALPSDDASEFDSKIAKCANAGEQYQAAFKFLSLRRPPVYRDRIIRVAVLSAYNRAIDKGSDLDPNALMEYETDADNWKLPAGVESLGRIWTGLPASWRGPILTTNFDPLCEISLRRSGGSPSVRVMDADGSFLRDIRASDSPQIIHLHGYWRESATLNMTTQLTLERPALNGSLRALLGQYTLLVLGYGAWRDAIMSQLHQILAEQSAHELDVLWCFHGDESELEAQLSNNPVLERLLQAPGNVQFYTGIDVNTALPTIEAALAPFLDYPDVARVSHGHGSLVGWDPLPTSLHERDISADKVNALTFFDGRLPNWDDTANQFIPRRDIVATLTNQLGQTIASRTSSFTTIIGASGEGKTTALMQAAISLQAAIPEMVVLFSDDGRISSTEEIMSLPMGTAHLLVIDEAFRSVDRLRELASALQKDNRKNLHILISSRDTDWSSAGGFTFTWSRYLTTKHHKLTGISRPDATSIVHSWQKLGPAALGELAAFRTTNEQIAALMAAASDSDIADEGAFLGALLATRYGAGLVDHIRELLLRLTDRSIHSFTGTSDRTLLDALFMIALPHASGVRTMGNAVLARSLGIAEQELLGSVLLLLGEEAAISFNSKNILIRHSLIAKAACDIASEVGIDLAEIATEIVRSAVEIIEESGAARPELISIAYLSQKLDTPRLRVAAAQSAVNSAPNRISYRTSLSSALRDANDAPAAVDVCENALNILQGASDLATGIRPFFTEWGVAEGNLDRFARNTFLACIALQDLTGIEPVREEHACTAVVCLAFGIRRLWSANRRFVYLAGLAGLVTLSDGMNLNLRQRRWIDEADKVAFENGAPQTLSRDAAAEALSKACISSKTLLEKPLSLGLPTLTMRFTEFSRLRR